MKHKTGKELVVITTNITYSWFSVTKIFNIDYPNQDGDRTTFQALHNIGFIGYENILLSTATSWRQYVKTYLNNTRKCI